MARDLVDAAAAAGADAVKFQTFNSSKLVAVHAKKADYQKTTTGSGSQLDMLKSLELSPDAFQQLALYCKERGIEFLSSAFDEESLALIVSLGVSRLKLGSGELTNGLMLRACAQTRLPLILSTGMATIDEIESAVGLVAETYLKPEEQPASASWGAAATSELGRAALRQRVTLLHCTTEYPCPFDQVDLRAMNVLTTKFGLPVGYSDHTPGISVSLAAVALGAQVIEKHLTLNRSLPGPDHSASIEPAEFALLVKSVREVEMARGREEKLVHAVEERNKQVARRSLVALRDIAPGEIFTPDNVASRRPGTGISPMLFWSLLGRKARQKYNPDDLISSAEFDG
jgi:N-acetylneuraminate synthase